MARRQYKGVQKYETLLKLICNVDDFDKLPEREWEGCIGVACVISIMEGADPSLHALSKSLDIPHYNRSLKNAFERLKINNIFSDEYDIKGDMVLRGQASSTDKRTKEEIERDAWCIIAGVAGGFSGIQSENKVTQTAFKEKYSKYIEMRL